MFFGVCWAFRVFRVLGLGFLRTRSFAFLVGSCDEPPVGFRLSPLSESSLVVEASNSTPHTPCGVGVGVQCQALNPKP